LVLEKIHLHHSIVRFLTTVQILVPCYNPSSGWAEVLYQRFLSLQTAVRDRFLLDLVLVNDGSTNGVTQLDVAFLRSQMTHFTYLSYNQNKGKGAALRYGAAQSQAHFTLFTDIDFPYTDASMIDVLDVLVAQGGIVSGHREESYYQKVPVFRRLLSKVLRLMLKYLMRLPVTDSQCGLKGMDTAGKSIFLETTIDRYLFDLEFLQLANKRIEVRPVRVELRSGITFTTMGIGILRTEFKNFLRLLFS
jgi:glycosyltransferase involved in cell wall biosynthesis